MRRTGLPTRRSVLGTLAAVGTVGLAGCDGLPGESATDGRGRSDSSEETGSGRTTDRPTAAESDAAIEQTVSVGNPNATNAYVTVVVESMTGETAVVESLDLSPGERWRLNVTVPGPGAYRVLAETATGVAGAFDWRTDERLDGCSLTLRGDRFDFWRTAVCRTDCRLTNSDVGDPLPLVGDGDGRWYAPASVVLENPEPSANAAAVTVELGGDAVLSATYDVPAGTQVELPVTYRSGDYRVRVETRGRTVSSAWPVPNQPSLFVDLGDRTTGCGPANSELRLVNYDDAEHTVGVQIASDEERLFADRWTLAPGERTSVVPVASSGRYVVRARIDDADPFYSVWWSCPPRGPATLVVDATGGGSLSQTTQSR